MSALRCAYCGKKMGGTLKKNRRSRDHIFPRVTYGRDGPVVIACFDCNSTRGEMHIMEWLDVLSQRAGAARQSAAAIAVLDALPCDQAATRLYDPGMASNIMNLRTLIQCMLDKQRSRT